MVPSIEPNSTYHKYIHPHTARLWNFCDTSSNEDESGAEISCTNTASYKLSWDPPRAHSSLHHGCDNQKARCNMLDTCHMSCVGCNLNFKNGRRHRMTTKVVSDLCSGRQFRNSTCKLGPHRFVLCRRFRPIMSCV